MSPESYLLQLQESICDALAETDGQAVFKFDKWTRQEGGGGRSCILQNGRVFEKAGVNFSHVLGEHLPRAATAQRPELANRAFTAMGVSLVIHPLNPYVPTTHCNVRFFNAHREGVDPVWWFGGGFDLTPYYGFDEDCVHWHQISRQACDAFGKNVYPRYKKLADDYFYLPHRQERRGIGGLFYDDLNNQDLNQWDFEKCFAFTRSVGDHFLKAYLPIVEKRKNLVYGLREKDFQRYRRGRYVEFNLLYDRGTLFGIQSGGRTESILMSLPPEVSWRYDWRPEPNSPEAKLTEYYLVPREWV